MANNRLYLINTLSNETIKLAMHSGTGWHSSIKELHNFFNSHENTKAFFTSEWCYDIKYEDTQEFCLKIKDQCLKEIQENPANYDNTFKLYECVYLNEGISKQEALSYLNIYKKNAINQARRTFPLIKEKEFKILETDNYVAIKLYLI